MHAQQGPPVVRVAGLPADVPARLRLRESAALVSRLATEQDWLAAEAGRLSGALHSVIGAAGDSPLKPRLVGLRRAVHQTRRPARSEWNSEIRALLPAEVAVRLQEWLARLSGWQRARLRLGDVLEREVSDQAAALRELAAGPAFRRALWLASPVLSAELDKLLADPTRQLPRQVAFRLAKYLGRAATKTSPYSTFTASGFGRWSAAGPAVRLDAGRQPRGVLELRGRLRAALRQCLAGQPATWQRLPVRLNPSVTLVGDACQFLGQQPAEPILTVPATGWLRECLRLFESGGTNTLGCLRDHLVAAAGVSPASAQRRLDQLQAIGLLEACPPVDRRDPLAAAAGWLAASGGSRPPGATVAVVPSGDHRGFLDRQAQLGDAYRDLATRAGAPTAGPGPIAMDTVVAPEVVAECGVPAWRPVLADLAAVRRWLAVFNPGLPVQLAAAEVWRARAAGRARLPFLLFHRMVEEEIAAGSPLGAELRRLRTAPPGELAEPVQAIPRSGLLRTYQERALRPIAKVCEPALRQGHTGQVRVDPAVLAAPARRWPQWIRPLASIGCYVQPVSIMDEHAVVLNEVTIGYGRGANRVAYLVGRAGGVPPAYGAWLTPRDGRLLAELAGGYEFTLDDRVPSVPYEIDYPGAVSDRPAEQRIRLSDLTVCYDRRGRVLRLWSDRLAAEITPLPLGLVSPLVLPPAARLAVQVFGEGSLSRGLSWQVWPPPPATPDGIRVAPRVVVGTVVLRRACWLMAGDRLPRRDAGERDADYLLRLHRWRVAAGIPARCFLRVSPAAGGSGRDRIRAAHKPAFVDFQSWFSVLALENTLRHTPELVLLEEALPDLSADEHPADARVVELLVEASAAAGGGGGD